MPAPELVYVCVFVPLRIKWACTIKSIHGGENLPSLPCIYVTANTDTHAQTHTKKEKARTHTLSHSLALFSKALCLFGNNTSGEEGGGGVGGGGGIPRLLFPL